MVSCVQLSLSSSNLRTGRSTEAIIFPFALIDAAAQCAASGAPERRSDERAEPSSARHPLSVQCCVRLICHQASGLVSAPAALSVECFLFSVPLGFNAAVELFCNKWGKGVPVAPYTVSAMQTKPCSYLCSSSNVCRGSKEASTGPFLSSVECKSPVVSSH